MPTTTAGLEAMLRYITDVQAGKYSSRIGAFAEDDVWNFLTSARDFIDDRDGLPRLDTRLRVLNTTEDGVA